MSEGKEKEKKPDLGLLEEDDEFEEFPAEGKSFRLLSNTFLLEIFIPFNNEQFFVCSLPGRNFHMTNQFSITRIYKVFIHEKFFNVIAYLIKSVVLTLFLSGRLDGSR